MILDVKRWDSSALKCLCWQWLLQYLSLSIVCVSDAQPTDGEREVWNQVNSVLQDSESILSGLQAYKGAGQEIRDVRNTHTHTAARSWWPLWLQSRMLSRAPSTGNSKPQWLHAAGASVELCLPAGHQTQEVLQLLPQTRYDHNARQNVSSLYFQWQQ